jgi:IK cytokine
MIQESKFLGGDMEHTHLVKGLDYALLNKVRSEIQAQEKAEEEPLEGTGDVKPQIGKAGVVEPPPTKQKTVSIEEEPEFRTKLARNVHRFA